MAKGRMLLVEWVVGVIARGRAIVTRYGRTNGNSSAVRVSWGRA